MLTAKQRGDLDLAVLEYLHNHPSDFSETIESFRKESRIENGINKSASKNLLERKWNSIIRLQKKVMDLERQLVEQKAKGPSMALGGALKTDPLLSRTKSELSGHRSPVTCIAFHPVYNILVSGSEDATIKIWDAESGEYERTLKGHTNTIQSLGFNDKGTQLVSASADLSIKLWNFELFTCMKTFVGHDHNISGVKFLPNGETILSCSRDQTIKFWSIQSGFCSKTLTGHSDWVRSIDVSNDGKLVASGSSDTNVCIWDVNSGIQVRVLRGHSHVVEDVKFATGKAHRTLESLKIEDSSSALSPMSASSSGTPSESSIAIETVHFVVSASRDKTVRVWNTFTSQCLYVMSDHHNWVRGVIFHPTSHYVLSVSDDKTMKAWDLRTGRCVRTVDAHDHFVNCIDMHPSGSFGATGCIDKSIKIWQ